ncbi:protein SON [Neocloeon triangulifer]|uniref:protein SON n=1 Tax=Neocloeon triangulifer TaxID=2078957 RepID=UPI00286F98CE|nr:protein SON [Neocloeon triangulifer]
MDTSAECAEVESAEDLKGDDVGASEICKQDEEISADSRESAEASSEEKPAACDDEPELETKSSSKILEEIFDSFLTESSSKSKRKEKHKKSKHHKKKKKHSEKDKDRKHGDKEKKKKRSKSKERRREKDGVVQEENNDVEKNFYEKCDSDLIKSLEEGVKFDANRCDLYAAGELDSEEEKALSFECFRERADRSSLKRSISPDDENVKKRKIEIKDLKNCSVSKLAKKVDKVDSKHEEGEIPSSQDESEEDQKHHKVKRQSSKSRDSRDNHRQRSHESSRKTERESVHQRLGDSHSHRSSRRERSLERHHLDVRSRRSRSPHDARGARYTSRRRGDGRDARNEERIDKKKLLAIAKKNATYILKEQQERMLQAGVIPVNAVSNKTGKTVAELTEYCKKLVKSGSGSSDSDSESEISEGEGPTESFIHHPFQLRDRPNSIVVNIRNSTQLPNKSLQEKAAESSKIRSLQYPVSSGQQHRSTEWVPVTPTSQSNTASVAPLAIKEAPPTTSKPSAVVSAVASSCTDTSGNIDISSVISQKLSAMRKIQESGQTVTPGYGYGYGGGHLAALSGAFTGSTGARMLTPAELSSGQQAWARKDQLKTAAPVAGGMGMKLLQKMGWRPGEGLGKNKEGGLEPLNLDVKMDKKGLVAQEECRTRFQPFSGSAKKKGGGGGGGGAAAVQEVAPTVGHEVFSGKHPVSALVELCTKRRWGSPVFELVFESGPDHKKNFLFKVKVNGREYQDQIAYSNKKQAKAMAAQHCLLQLGLVVVM